MVFVSLKDLIMKKELLFFAGFSIGALLISAVMILNKPVEVEEVIPVEVAASLEVAEGDSIYEFRSDEFSFTFQYSEDLVRDEDSLWVAEDYELYQELINAVPRGPAEIFPRYNFMRVSELDGLTLEEYAVRDQPFGKATSFEEAELVEVTVHEQNWSHGSKTLEGNEVVWVTFPWDRFGPRTFFYVKHDDSALVFVEHSEGPEFPVMEEIIASLEFQK